MKITGRNIKHRLYNLRNLPADIKRARYFRGHGVHSPFVYAIVREVFMASQIKSPSHDLYDRLKAAGIPTRRAIQLQNLSTPCGYESVGIDTPSSELRQHQMVVITTNIEANRLDEYTIIARQEQLTLCIMAPYLDGVRQVACKAIIAHHPCTSIDNRGYLLLFNNHLPKQQFKL